MGLQRVGHDWVTFTFTRVYVNGVYVTGIYVTSIYVTFTSIYVTGVYVTSVYVTVTSVYVAGVCHQCVSHCLLCICHRCIYHFHWCIYVSATLPSCPTLNLLTPSLLCVHRSILYICVSIPALQIGSSVPFL